MKILLATYTLRGGGIESMVVALANELANSHDITVATIHTPQEGDFRRRLDSRVKVVDFGKNRSYHVPRAIVRLTRHISESNYDVVHIHGEFYYYIPTLLMRRQRRISFIYTVHNDAAKENSRWNRLFTPLKRHFFRSGRLKAAVISPASQRSFSAYYGSDVPSTLIPNGIPDPAIHSLAQPSSGNVFVCPARICAQKNQLELVKAFRVLVDEGSDIRLILAGPVEDRSLMERIDAYLCDRIIYIGVSDNIPVLLASASAMIMPSVYEGLPVALLESFAVGCPVICTPAGGMADTVADGINGIIIDGHASTDILASVRRFLSFSPGRVESMRLAARKAFSGFSIKVCAEDYEKLYLINNN